MIKIDYRKNRLVAALDSSSFNYLQVYKVVRGLLTSREIDNNVWSVGYDDFIILRKKLNKLGLTENRSITNDAIEFVNKIKSIDLRNRSIKKGEKNDFIKRILKGKLKNTLYEDQLNAVSYAYSNRRVGLFLPLGSGKTLISLASLSAIPKVKKTLVICPKSVMVGFKKEVSKHTYLKAITIPAGNREKAIAYFNEVRDHDWDICIVHPENLVGRKKSKIYGELAETLREFPFDMIVVDEYHQYKNIDAKRTKCVLSLLNGVRDHLGNFPRALLMTGTPVSESPLNAYTVLKVIGFDKLPHVSRFENYFSIKKEFTFGKGKKKKTFKKVVGHKNLGELKSRLERVSIHRTKHDLKGFPDKTETIKYLELSGDQKKIYKALCGEAKANLPLDKQINLHKYLNSDSTAVRLRQCLNSPEVLDTKSNSVKHEAIDEILEELLADEKQKVIIWTEYRKAVDLLYDRYNKKYGAVKIYGGIGNEEMERISDEFEGISGPRVAVCIPAKAGTGVDFLARARTAIYVDLPYSYTLYKQSLDRIHRRVKSGNDLSELDRIRSEPATIIFLEVQNTVDELVRDMLEGKDNIATAVTTADEKLIKIGRSDLLKYLS